MATQLSYEHWQVASGELYFIHPQHRNGSPEKSQWAVGHLEEATIFELAPSNVTAADDKRWGLQMSPSGPTVIGKQGEWLARFLGPTSPPLEWHGFPASRWPGDRPPDELLEAWSTGESITEAQAARLRKGIWQL
jgi:hypothetical protein